MSYTVVPTATSGSKTVTATDRTLVYTVTIFDLQTLADLFDDARNQVHNSGAGLGAATIVVNGPAKTITVTWTTVP